MNVSSRSRGRSALRDAIKAHGGFVTPGEVAYHLDFCAAGTAAFVRSHRMATGPQPVHEVVERLDGWLRNEYDLPDNPEMCLAMRAILSGMAVAKTATKPKGYSSTYRRWNDVLSRDVLTNTEITYLGHRLGQAWSGTGRTKLTEVEADDLFITVSARDVASNPYRLTHEQVAKGKAWLARPDVLREVGRDAWYSHDLTSIAASVTDFVFVGYHREDLSTAYRRNVVADPVYRAVSDAGWFDYSAYPWTQGRSRRLTIHRHSFR